MIGTCDPFEYLDQSTADKARKQKAEHIISCNHESCRLMLLAWRTNSELRPYVLGVKK